MAYQARFVDNALISFSHDLRLGIRRILQEDDDFLPEGVDSSEAGWSTDFSVAILGLLFVVTSYSSYKKENKHFLYMHLGTAMAHFFGGITHAVFPNRASDGTGMIGFYVSILLGYAGNCMRYGLGWGLHKYWAIAAGGNFLFLLIAGIVAIAQMEITTDAIDTAPKAEEGVPADAVFGYGELICAVMEIAASIAYVWKHRNAYAYVAAASNCLGWIAVYALGLWSVATGGMYNTLIAQLIFHYAMIVFLWAINELGLLAGSVPVPVVKQDIAEENDDGDNSKSVNLDTEHGTVSVVKDIAEEDVVGGV